MCSEYNNKYIKCCMLLVWWYVHIQQWFKLLNITFIHIQTDICWWYVCVCLYYLEIPHIDIVNSRFVSLLSPFWLLLMPPCLSLTRSLACLLARSLFFCAWKLLLLFFWLYGFFLTNLPFILSGFFSYFMSFFLSPSVWVCVGCGSNLDVRMN